MNISKQIGGKTVIVYRALNELNLKQEWISFEKWNLGNAAFVPKSFPLRKNSRGTLMDTPEKNPMKSH